MNNDFLQNLLNRAGLNLDLSSLLGGQGQAQQVPDVQLPDPNVTGAPPATVADQATLLKNILMKRFAPPAAAVPEPTKTPVELNKTDFSSRVPARQPLRTAVMNAPINATAHSGSGWAAGFAKFLQALNNVNAKNEELDAQDQARKAEEASKKDLYQWQKEFDINANEQNPQTQFDRDRRETELDLKQQAFDQKVQMDNLRQQILGARLGKIQGGGSKTAADNSELDIQALQELENTGVDTKNLSNAQLRKIYFNMNQKAATTTKKETGNKKFYADGSYVDLSDPRNPKYVASDKKYSPGTYQKAAEGIDAAISNIRMGKKDEELTPEELSKVNELKQEGDLYRNTARDMLKKGGAKPGGVSSASAAAPAKSSNTPAANVGQIFQARGKTWKIINAAGDVEEVR